MQVNSKSLANCERLKCSACEFGKGNCLSNKVNAIKNNPMKKQDLKKDHLLTGQTVSADPYTLWSPGKIYYTKGKSDPSEMFSGGRVFIYYASGYVIIKL